MTNQTIAIVGATGKTGARVLAQLQAAGQPVRALSRNSQYAFDWTDKAGWEDALRGVQSVYLTYFPDLAVPQAESDIRHFVDLASKLEVEHIVLLSGRGEEGAQRAEEVVKNSDLDWNIVRASWFMQNFSESFMLDGIRAGELVLPEPKAREPFIDVQDIVDMAVAALTRRELRNQLFEITGPDLLGFDNCVAAIAAASNRDIGFRTAPIDLYLKSAKAEGLPADIVWLINELFVNVLDGRNESVTDTLESVLGRPARSFSQYVEDTAKTAVWS